jgi:hypothetical protein
MKIKGKGIVQLGLHKQAEFVHYLGAEPKYYSKEAPIGTPDFYLGIDCDPASIVHMINEYSQFERVEFMCSGVGASTIKRGLSWCSNKCPFIYPSLPLHTIFSEVGITELELLAMDVEGAELDILASYDWSVMPSYLIVEAHSFNLSLSDAVAKIDELVFSKGYKKEKEFKTNLGQECPTMELEYALVQ